MCSFIVLMPSSETLQCQSSRKWKKETWKSEARVHTLDLHSLPFPASDPPLPVPGQSCWNSCGRPERRRRNWGRPSESSRKTFISITGGGWDAVALPVQPVGTSGSPARAQREPSEISQPFSPSFTSDAVLPLDSRGSHAKSLTKRLNILWLTQVKSFSNLICTFSKLNMLT